MKYSKANTTIIDIIMKMYMTASLNFKLNYTTISYITNSSIGSENMQYGGRKKWNMLCLDY
ncbi:hypothetical protein GCM10010969_03520 [Saccharibacillus kuerlensis]|uniref:Uncharacterized protein n=1 Tax=Saccharibacillus kuerlensis TaxID=459527 RepID=A0ABQ2KS69_9BACL|nr:hypothetical protein GCM10010969_03520 [Saccharibacillus kuerlensis]